MSATYNLAYPIVEHCQHCRSKKNKELDTFLFNDNSDNVRQFYKSCAQHIILHPLLSTIVEHCRSKKNKRLDTFLFNDNFDND